METWNLKCIGIPAWEVDPRNTLPLLCKSALATCLAAGLWLDLRISMTTITASRRPIFETMIASRLCTTRTLDVSPPARTDFGIGTWNGWLLPHLTNSSAPILQRLNLTFLNPEDLQVARLPPSLEALALHFQGSATASEDMLGALSRLPRLRALDVRVTWPTLLAAFGPGAVLRSWSSFRKLTLRVGEAVPRGLDPHEALEGLPWACPRLASLALYLPAIHLPPSFAALLVLRRLTLCSPEAAVEGLHHLTQCPLLLLAVQGVARPPSLACTILRLNAPEDRLQGLVRDLASLHGLRCLALRLHVAWSRTLGPPPTLAWPRLRVLQLACRSTLVIRLPDSLRVLQVRDTNDEQMMLGGGYGAKAYPDVLLPRQLQALNLVSSKRGVERPGGGTSPALRLLGVTRGRQVVAGVERVVHTCLDFWEAAADLPGIQLSQEELSILLDSRDDD